MKPLVELVVTPPAGIDIAALDALDEVRRAFARGPAHIEQAESGSWWFKRFGITRQADWPAAAFRLPMRDAPQRWCADPVHLQVNGDAVVLDAGACNDLSADDATTAIAILNRHFAEDGLRFCAATPSQWLLESDHPVDAATAPPALAHARSIETHLPQGTDARMLKRVGNEAQMLLHECALNDAREARGQAPINGVWLWGGARSTPNPAPASGLTVLSDALHVQGIARAAGATCAALPADAGAIAPIAGPVVIDLFTPFADPETWAAWFSAHWLLPLRNHRGRVRLTLDLPNAIASIELFRIDPWRLLRRGGLAKRLAAAGIEA